MLNKKNIGPLLIILAAFLWSFDGFLRRSLYVLPPLVVVFWEHFIGFLILLPFLFGHIGWLKKISKQTWGAILWVTILSSICGTVFYTAALGKIQFIQFSVVVLLQQLQPAFEVFFGWILLKEHISKRFIPWFIVSLIGAYFVTFPNLTVNLSTGGGTISAALLALAAAFSWGSSTAFSRYALLQMPSRVTTGIRFGLASLFTFIILFLSGQYGTVVSVSNLQFTYILYIALSTGMVALSIYYFGLQRTPVWISSICELTWPLSAIAMDYFIFNKTLTVTQWLGALIIIMGIYNITKHHIK